MCGIFLSQKDDHNIYSKLYMFLWSQKKKTHWFVAFICGPYAISSILLKMENIFQKIIIIFHSLRAIAWSEILWYKDFLNYSKLYKIKQQCSQISYLLFFNIEWLGLKGTWDIHRKHNFQETFTSIIIISLKLREVQIQIVQAVVFTWY